MSSKPFSFFSLSTLISFPTKWIKMSSTRHHHNNVRLSTQLQAARAQRRMRNWIRFNSGVAGKAVENCVTKQEPTKTRKLLVNWISSSWRVVSEGRLMYRTRDLIREQPDKRFKFFDNKNWRFNLVTYSLNIEILNECSHEFSDVYWSLKGLQ